MGNSLNPTQLYKQIADPVSLFTYRIIVTVFTIFEIILAHPSFDLLLLPSGAAPPKVSPVAGLRVRGAAIVVAPSRAGGPRPAAPADPAVMLRPPAAVPGARVGVRLLGVAVARVLLAADVAAAGGDSIEIEFRLEKSLDIWLEIPYTMKMFKN